MGFAEHANRFVKRIVTDHHTVLFVGIMLFIMGAISLSENLLDKVFGIHFQIAYGFILLGAFNILMAVAFIIMGTMNIEAGLSTEEPSPLEALEQRVKELEARIEKMEKTG